MLRSHLLIGFSSAVFLLIFLMKNFVCFDILSHVCYMPYHSLTLLFHHPCVVGGLQIMKLFTV
jgi:hypothetical protein